MNWYKTSQSKIRLWLDDKRDPKNPKIREKYKSSGDEIWVKTVEEAKAYLEQGNVSYISFDNDLGLPLEGRHLANWIEEKAYNNEIPRLEWRVHSQNPKGAEQIKQAMQNADKYWSEHEQNSLP